MDVMQCKHVSDRIVPVDPLCSNCNTYEVRRVHSMSYGVCIWSTVYTDSRESPVFLPAPQMAWSQLYHYQHMGEVLYRDKSSFRMITTSMPLGLAKAFRLQGSHQRGRAVDAWC